MSSPRSAPPGRKRSAGAGSRPTWPRGCSFRGSTRPRWPCRRRRFSVPDPTALWQLGVDTGRAYAAVSGDFNPIHLSVLTAKALGHAPVPCPRHVPGVAGAGRRRCRPGGCVQLGGGLRGARVPAGPRGAGHQHGAGRTAVPGSARTTWHGTRCPGAGTSADRSRRCYSRRAAAGHGGQTAPGQTGPPRRRRRVFPSPAGAVAGSCLRPPGRGHPQHAVQAQEDGFDRARGVRAVLSSEPIRAVSA